MVWSLSSQSLVNMQTITQQHYQRNITEPGHSSRQQPLVTQGNNHHSTSNQTKSQSQSRTGRHHRATDQRSRQHGSLAMACRENQQLEQSRNLRNRTPISAIAGKINNPSKASYQFETQIKAHQLI
jgi:hypothetical protein